MTAKFDHAMLDIETLGLHTSRSLILSLAVVPFNLRHGGPEFGRKLLLVFDIKKQIMRGRRIEAGTVAFWAKQTPEAAAHWADPLYESSDATILPNAEPFVIRNIFHRNEEGDNTVQLEKDYRVWSNGAVFDFGNLENLLADEGIDAPWHYRSVSDLRTITLNTPQRRVMPETVKAACVAHDPVSDCVWQAWKLWEHADASIMYYEREPSSV